VIDSFLATSDMGWAFTSLYGDDPAGHGRQSPLTYVDRMTAPLPILHSENDLRCPLEQAQRLFAALHGRNRTVEMLVFPVGGHELSRSGLPSHRIARFEAILDRLARHLRVAGRRKSPAQSPAVSPRPARPTDPALAMARRTARRIQRPGGIRSASIDTLRGICGAHGARQRSNAHFNAPSRPQGGTGNGTLQPRTGR
jgi:hypothetical protein